MPLIPELPPIAVQPLSVLLLARDAAAALELTLTRWVLWLDARRQDYELILVDDGSGDGTADKAVALAGRWPRVRVVRREAPGGQGAALRTALAEARHPLLFYCPCHPDYRPEHLGLLLDRTVGEPTPIKEIDRVHLLGGFRAGVPVGLVGRIAGGVGRVLSRVLLAYSPPPSPGALGWRRQLLWLFARVFFGLRYHDVASPVRLLRREILARIPIQSAGPFAHVELLAKANFLGCLMGEEVPLDVKPPSHHDDLAGWRKDARRLLRNPDFGPAVLPTPLRDDEGTPQLS